MNFYDYLANNVPNDCYVAMQNRAGRNIPRPRKPKHLAMMLNRYVEYYGKDALNDLLNVHPDKDLLMSSNVANNSNFGINEVVQNAEKPHTDDEYVSSDCGCGSKKGGCKCGGKCGGDCKCKSKKENKSCGCGCGDKHEEKNFSNLVQGETDSYSKIPTESKTHEILISVGVIILGLAVAVKLLR